MSFVKWQVSFYILQMMSFSCMYFSDFLILQNENVLFLPLGKKKSFDKNKFKEFGRWDHHETYSMGFSKTVQEDLMFPMTGTAIGKVPFYWTTHEKSLYFFLSSGTWVEFYSSVHYYGKAPFLFYLLPFILIFTPIPVPHRQPF